MAHWKDNWKTIYQTDQSWLRVPADGDNDKAELEFAQEVGEDDDGNPKFQLFRFPVERLKLVTEGTTAYLVPLFYGEDVEGGGKWGAPSTHEEWFADSLGQVADSCDTTELELAQAFTSEDPKVRTYAYECVGGYHGFINFDGYPVELTEEELNERWS